MTGDRGYPDGARTTPVPDLFFSRDLIEIADPVALKAALFVLWRTHRHPTGAPAAVAEPDLAADSSVIRALTALGVPPGGAGAALAAALDALVAHGTLLAASGPSDDGPVRWLFVNSHDGRAACTRWRAGDVRLAEAVNVPGSSAERPNAFALYEANIGLITPLQAEMLRDAEATYPAEWIADAIARAVDHNARRWSYVRAILERWAREGRDNATDRQGARLRRERDSEGPYGAFVKR